MALSIRGRALRVLLAFAIGATLISIGLANGYRIGIDGQRLVGDPACLEETLFVLNMKLERAPTTGDHVVALMPDTGMPIGGRAGNRIIKLVAAVPGDQIEVKGTELYINGHLKDRLWLAKSIPGKKPGDFDTHFTLQANEYFLMGTSKESFDSRYWGKVHLEAIRGFAYPVI